MSNLRNLGHQRHDGAGKRADHEGERDQIEFVAAQQRPQPNHDAVRPLAIGEMSDPQEHSLPALLFRHAVTGHALADPLDLGARKQRRLSDLEAAVILPRQCLHLDREPHRLV
ncbi:hypothetical protein ACVWW4_007855 [Bradyrhizobium sp. LB7.1]